MAVNNTTRYKILKIKTIESNAFRMFHIWREVKGSSGRFHTRQFVCKQPVADVQQARRVFTPLQIWSVSLLTLKPTTDTYRVCCLWQGMKGSSHC